jgi:hypothetical protein
MALAPDDIILTGPAFQQKTVDNLLLTPPGGVQTTLGAVVGGGNSPALVSIANALTASTTQTLAGALPLTAEINIISTVATAGNAAKLPPVNLNFGQVVTVMNNGASACAIFPFETATAIDSAGTAASVTITNGRSANFFQNSTSTWVSQGSVGHAT